MKEYEKVLQLTNRPIEYSDRAKMEIERAHFTEDMLLELLKNPKSVHHDERGFLIRGGKTAKIRLKITDEETIFITSFSYNKVPFVF